MDLADAATVAASPLTILGKHRPLAHHPHCGRYDQHLLRPLGIPLCLGCVCMYSGLLLTLVAVLYSWPPTSFSTALIFCGVGGLALVPTFLQPFVQRRWFKIPSRLALGAGLGLLVGALLVAPLDWQGWVFRALVVGITAGLARLAMTLRDRQRDDPCQGCPWGTYPLCAHNLEHLVQVRAAADDPSTVAFLDCLIQQLEPLAAVPPQWGKEPPAVESPSVHITSGP